MEWQGQDPMQSTQRRPHLRQHITMGGGRSRTSALANAINGVAWLLHDKLGRGIKHDTEAYIGPNHIAYVIMILGATKAGYKVCVLSMNDEITHSQKTAKLSRVSILSVSPRNTVADHISLLQATDCHTLVTPSAAPSPIIPSIVKKYSLRLIDSPSLYDLLDGAFPHYPYHKIFAEAKFEPLVVPHTSGTTSIPKPVIYAHEFAPSYRSWTRLLSLPGFQSQIMMLQSKLAVRFLAFLSRESILQYHSIDATIL